MLTRLLQFVVSFHYPHGNYSAPLYLGDLKHVVIGMLDDYHLRHDSRRCDCTIYSFRRQTHNKILALCNENNADMP